MAGSPTQRSLEYMRAKGYRCEKVERWNPFAKRLVDLWGFIDIVCVGCGETVGVQTTTKGDSPRRIEKILASPALDDVTGAGWVVVVHGWRKRRGRWEVDEIVISTDRSVVLPRSPL